MTFLEKDLEEIIYETYKSDPIGLKKRGLYLNGIIKRQLRIGNYGIADLVTFERDIDYEYSPDRFIDKDDVETMIFECYTTPKLIVTVYELKKDKIGISAYLQALKYIKGIKRYLDEREFNYDVGYNIVLIGKELDTSGSFCFIPDFSSNVEFYTYNYDLDGLKFKNKKGYILTDENFKL